MTDTNEPLASPESEAAVIGALMLAPDRLVEAQARLQLDDFTRPDLRLIYSALLDLHRSSVPYTPIALMEHMRAQGTFDAAGGIEALVGFNDRLNLVEVPRFSQHARLLADTGNMRRMAAKLTELSADVLDVRAPIHEQVCAYFSSVLSQVREMADKATASMEGKTSADILDAATIRAGQPKDNRPTVKFGLMDLDGMGDILRRGRLIVVGARPGVGKSTMLLHIGLEAARSGTHAALVSMEMPDEELAERITAHEMNRPMPPTGFGPDAYAYVARDQIHQLLHINATNRLTLQALYEYAKDSARRGNCGILLVDYLQLLRVTRCENRQQEVSAVARGLKDIALELDIPVVAAAQLNRTVTADEAPGLSNLRESGDIEAAADVAILLWRREREDNRLQVNVAKFRGGKAGKCELDYRPETYTIRSAQPFGQDLMAIEAKDWK